VARLLRTRGRASSRPRTVSGPSAGRMTVGVPQDRLPAGATRHTLIR